MIGANKSCKISDFGLTRLVYEEKVYMGKRSRRLPIKWMSIEAIIDQVFTTASDVYVIHKFYILNSHEHYEDFDN